MKPLILTATILILTTSQPVSAWNGGLDWLEGNDTLNSQQIGPFRYDSGTINGQQYRGTRQTIGNFDYYNGQIGDKRVQCTTQWIGNQSYTTCR